MNRLTQVTTLIVTLICVSLTSAGCGGGMTVPVATPSTTSLAFAAPTTISPGGAGSGSLVLADFNGDGKLDIAVSNFDSKTISVLLNKGDGTFRDPIISPIQIAALGLGPIAVGDFNHDGKPDLVVGTIAGAQANIVLLGNGDGTFRQLPPIPGSFGFIHARVVDLNGDGHLDLVTSNVGNISVFLGRGDGTFTASPLPPLGYFSSVFLGVVVGDFNGDNKLDIVGCDWGAYQSSPRTGALVFLAGKGDGTFQSPTVSPLSPSFPGALASADFFGRGKQDLIIGYPNMARLARGNGDGTFQIAFQNPSELVVVYAAPTFDVNGGMALQTADLNLDGKPDALVGDPHLGVLSLILNDGIGKVSPPAGTQYQFTLEPGIGQIAVGDLNGDGLPDIAVPNILTNKISIILSQKH